MVETGACGSSCAVVRGVGGAGTHGTALGSITGDCSGLWLAKYKQIVSQLPG